MSRVEITLGDCAVVVEDGLADFVTLIPAARQLFETVRPADQRPRIEAGGTGFQAERSTQEAG